MVCFRKYIGTSSVGIMIFLLPWNCTSDLEIKYL